MAHEQEVIYCVSAGGLWKYTDSGIVMVDGTFFGDSSEQNRSWEDSAMTISGI